MAQNLFDGTTQAPGSLLQTLWPGTLAVTLPKAGSGKVAPLLDPSGNVVGGVLAKVPGWDSVILDFIAVGAADLTAVVEVGSIDPPGTQMPRFLGTLTIKSVTTGTLANTEPYTGEAIAVTWRFFDALTVASEGQLGQLLPSLNGTENNRPSQATLDVTEAAWYYFLMTTLPGGLTRFRCDFTPVPN